MNSLFIILIINLILLIIILTTKLEWRIALWKHTGGHVYNWIKRKWDDWQASQVEGSQAEDLPDESNTCNIEANDPMMPEAVQQATRRPPVIKCPPDMYQALVSQVMQVQEIPEGMVMIFVDDHIANGQDWEQLYWEYNPIFWT
jgi:hypothetical protein